jgi:CRP/FNR family cyclic AMP-dependent transcriptional regulator
MSEALRTLAERGEQRRYRKGTLIIQEGEFGDTLYIVLAGRLQAYSTDDSGRDFVFGTYGPGDYVGEMSLDGGPRSANVITLEPTTCAVVTRRRLREHIAAHPDFAFELLGRVIRRARLATRDARNLALIDTYGRLVQLLDDLAAPQADGTRLIGERLTHRELAARVGCSREMVSRLMKDLEAGKFVVATRDGLRIRASLPARW